MLEHTHADPHAWDWKEQATAYGPFADEDTARCHLGDHHSNPGGSTHQPFEAEFVMGEILAGLIATAQQPDSWWRPKAAELAAMRAHRVRAPLYAAQQQARGAQRVAADALLAACQATALPPGEAVQDAILGYQNACAAHVAASQAVRVSEGFR